MSKATNPTIIKSDGLPVSFLVNTLFGKDPVRFDLIETDLLVLDMHEHMHVGGGLKEFDTVVGGALGQALEKRNFEGALGDAVLVSIPDRRIKNVLVVGVGRADQSSRFTFCGFIRLVFETARRLGVKRVTMPMFPGRFGEIGLAGTLAVLRCRTEQFSTLPGGLGSLEEIEILSTPQAKRWIVDGLTVSKPLCQTCSDPQITIRSSRPS